MPEGYMDAAAVPVPDAGDDALRLEMSEIAHRVITEHEPRPMSCACGAEIGDDIDRRWHLINRAVAAATEHTERAVEQVIAVSNSQELSFLERAETAEAELDRLHSWGGLLELLDEHWPADIFPMSEGLDDAKSRTRRDTGPVILGLIRWVDKLNAEVRDLRAALDGSETS